MIDVYLNPSSEVIARYDEIGRRTCEVLARLTSRGDDGSQASVALPVRDD
jgi:hypothetical protein